MVVTPNMFEDLSIKLLNRISHQYDTVYVACDRYTFDTSIKRAERKSRGVIDNLVIPSPNVQIPAFKFQNGDNNERLFEIYEADLFRKQTFSCKSCDFLSTK